MNKIDIYFDMKILITGGAGFIGYNFCKYLLTKTNHKVYSIDNVNDYYSQKLKIARLKDLKKHKNFKFYKFDLCNKKNLEKFLKLISTLYIILRHKQELDIH